MKIAKVGIKMVILGLIAAAAGFWPSIRPFGYGLTFLGVAFAAFCAYFFRDPERPLPTDLKKLYAPGDGRVLSVAKEGPGDVTTIRIFLSIFNVHIQRLPCSGWIEEVQHQDGKFAMAMRPEASLNEKIRVRIKPEGGRPPLVVDQIAGYIARRIECWVGKGEQVRAGERYGIIYFGSQVAVHLPVGATPIVNPGDRTVAGVTPIAQWTN